MVPHIIMGMRLGLASHPGRFSYEWPGNEAGLTVASYPGRFSYEWPGNEAGLTVAAVGSEEADRTRTIPCDVVTVSSLTCALLQTAQAIATRRTHCNNRT